MNTTAEESKVCRGDSWINDSRLARVYSRDWLPSDEGIYFLGFRTTLSGRSSR